MPLYEYQCDACGRRFERIQKFSDPPETVCPSCGGSVRKLLSSPAIQFKGSGFYITDYVKSGSSSEAGRTKPSSDGASSGASSSDASPSSSTDTKSTESSNKAEPAKASTGTGTKS